MNEINTFVVAAWPAAGKSVASREIIHEFNKAGMDVAYYSDKEALLSQVEYEILLAGKSLHQESKIEVDNFTLLNPSEPRVSWGIRFKNSATLNEAHRKLFESIASMRSSLDGKKAVIELAYGENAPYPDGSLRQNAKDFLDQFEHVNMLDAIAFVDIYARLKFRRVRNLGRKDEVGYIPDDEFVKYFKDIGGFTREDRERLGSRYKQIRNEYIPKWLYQWKVRDTVDNFILPLIGREGQSFRMETQKHAGRVEF